MKRFSFILVPLAVAVLTGCSKQEAETIKADRSQTNSSAVIALNGTAGTIKMDPGPGFPNGLNQAVEDVTTMPERIAPGSYKTRRIRITEWKQELVFSVVGGGRYICISGCTGNLPLEWHTEQ